MASNAENASIWRRHHVERKKYAIWFDILKRVQVSLASDICALLLANPLRCRHNERDGVSNHRPHDCLLNRLFRCRSKKTSKLRVTGLCEGNSSATGEFPAQRASDAENVSIWWRHHVCTLIHMDLQQSVSMKLIGKWCLITQTHIPMTRPQYGN